MVSEVVTSVWVDEHTGGFRLILTSDETMRSHSRQGAPVHSQPSKQGTCLVRREGIDFKHGHRVRTNWFLTEAKNHKLWVGRK